MLKTAPRGKGTYLDRKYDLLSFRGFRPSLYAFDEHKTRPWRRLAGDRWSEGAGRDAIDHELLHAGLNKRSRDEFCKRVRHVEDALHVYDRAQRFVTVRGRRLLNVYEPCMLETGESGAVEAWADIRKVLLNLHDGNEKHLEWTLDWLATIIQDIRMGRPQLTGVATIFYGPSQGVGKGVLGEVLRALVGTRNMVTIRQQELDETFNGWAAGKLLVVANEVFSSENRTEAESNRLKPYISDPTIQVREMYAMPVERPNVSNWVAFSNNLRPVPVEQRDRRYTLFKVGPPIDPNLGGRVADDARAGGPGVRAFLRHLLEREPTVFRRYTPLATEAKAEVQYDTAHSGEKFVHDLLKGDGFHALADDYIRECGATDLYVRQEDETLVERRVLYEVYRRWALASGYRAIASSQLYRLVRSAGAKEERRRWGNRQAWFFLGLPGVAPHLLDAGGSSASFRTDGGAAREVSPQLAEAQRILEAV
jgi:Holliday junction resolvase-like predicted endonuclease